MSSKTWAVRYTPFSEDFIKLTCRHSHKAFFDYVTEQDLSLYDIYSHLEAGEHVFLEPQQIRLEQLYKDIEEDMKVFNIKIEFISTIHYGEHDDGEEYEGFAVTNETVPNPDIMEPLLNTLTECEWIGGG